MMLYNKNIEYFSYLIYLLGTIMDHVTTKIGINDYSLVEANIFSSLLMQRGFWLSTNLILFLVVVLLSSCIFKSSDLGYSYFVLILPTICGLVKIFLAIHNYIIIIQ